MKKHLTLLVAIVATFYSFGQTDEQNLKKYWKFRNQFVEKFVKIGSDFGESLPIGALSPLDCWDNAGIGEQKGAMYWGDGGVRQGHYLALLATEFALRKKYGMELDGILNEIYFALNALNRVDEYAEGELDNNYGIDGFYSTNSQLNGYYLREDIPEDFCLNWELDELQPRCVNSPNYTNNNTLKLDNGANLVTTNNTSYQNTPSIDQMCSILYGIRLIHKLVDDVEVTPPGESPMYVVTEAVAIADRMIEFAAEHNWCLIDVNGWPVNSNGGDLSVSSYPLIKTWMSLHNGAPFPYTPAFIRRTRNYVDVQGCRTGFAIAGNSPVDSVNACLQITGALEWLTYDELAGGENAGLLNNQNISVFQEWQLQGSVTGSAYDLAYTWETLLPQAMPLDFPINTMNDDLNKKLAFFLGISAGFWEPIDVHLFGEDTKNYEFELVNAVLRDETPLRSQGSYKQMLDGLDQVGPYLFEEKFPSVDVNNPDPSYDGHAGGWSTEYRWTNNVGAVDPVNGRKGIFNALDYMIMHNLYYLVYGSSMPDFEEDYECFCTDLGPVPPVTSSPLYVSDPYYQDKLDKLTIKRNYLFNCVEHVFSPANGVPNNIVNGVFDVEPYFDDYLDLNIATVKFQTENTTVTPNSTVNAKTTLVVCDQSTLTIENEGLLRSVTGDVQVNFGGTVDVYGTVLIEPDTKLWVKESGKIILRDGARLIISDNSVVDIEGVLEFYDGASLEMLGNDAEFRLSGIVQMNNGGIFEFDHSSSSESGRVILEGVWPAFVTLQNAPGVAEVHLYGKDRNDEFLKIAKDTELKVTHFEAFNIDKLVIHSCLVEMEENSRLEVRQEINAYNAKFIAGEINQGINIARANHFTAVDFQNVNIHANLNILHGHKLRMTSCTMTNFTIGTDINEPMVDVNGTGMVINNSTFIGPNLTYIYAENLNYPSTVSGSTFNGVNTGGPSVAIEDRSNAELRVFQNTFNNMKIGVWKLYDPVTAKCNTFNNSSHSDIGGVYGSDVNITTDDYGGYNSFNSADATHGNVWLWYGDVDITNGRNYFNPSSDKYIYARMNYPCPNNLYCFINADNNQWNTGAQQPSSNKFDIVGSDLSPINLAVTTTEVMPACGYYDGQYTTGTEILPNVSTSLGDLPLDKAIHFARQEMTINDSTANDEDALKLFGEIFSANVPLDSVATRKWMYRALSDMKSSLESEYYMQTVLQESGQNPVMDYVNNYLTALNYMTPTTITADNYRQAFHLELDKAQLYRMMEMPEDGLEILEQTELCGLDSTEQEIVNYWKEQLEYDLLYDVWGMDILDTTMNVDTRNYITPTSNPAVTYNFGTYFNSLTDRTYAECSNGARMADESEQTPLVHLGIYPVPADEEINITIEAEAGIELRKIYLYDAMGRLMGEIDLAPEQQEVRNYSIRNWSTGVYYYNVSGPSGIYGGGTFVVE